MLERQKNMKLTIEERFRKKMKQIRKKNIVFNAAVLPICALGELCFAASSYFSSNKKRFTLIFMSLMLFVAYSSFTFPIFIMEDITDNVFHNVLDSVENIVLAEENEITPGDIILLDDSDVLSESDVIELAHGMIFADTFSANDILGTEETDNQYDLSDEEQNVIVSDNNSKDADVYRDYEFSPDDWRIMLINKQHSILDDYEPILGEINTMKGIMQCDARIIDELKKMMQDAKTEGIILAICSPYRDMEYQKMLFNRKINKYMDMGFSYLEAYLLAGEYVTVPGASEHQLGLALDIVCNTYTSLNAGFANTDAGKWLAANCHKYGFILRYPLGKEDITGIGYEPWHFRYVGVEAATIIMEEEITLEEFWEEYL